MILEVQSHTLKAVVLLLIAALAGLAVRVIASATQGQSIYGAVTLVAGFLMVAVGLWQLRAWARAVVVAFIWMLIIVGPLARINPFAAMEALGPNPPSVWQLAALIYPCVAMGIFVLHVLGTHKHEFSRHATDPQDIKPGDPTAGGPTNPC